MKVQYKLILEIFVTVLLYILGIIIISWLLWSRFIRERLPKDIPFELTEFLFYILVYICCVYLFIIYNLMRKSKENNFTPYIKKIIEYIYMPLTSLDKFIKTNKFCLEKSIVICKKLAKILDPFSTNAILDPWGIMSTFYFFYNILPRLLLVSLLLIDIFVLKKIDLFYTFIFIGIIPLTHRYLKYSIKNIDEIYQKILEKHWTSIYLLADRNFSKWKKEDFENEDNLEFDGYYDQEAEFNKALKFEFKYHENIMTIKEFLEFKKDEESIYYNAYPLPDENFVINYIIRKYP